MARIPALDELSANQFGNQRYGRAGQGWDGLIPQSPANADTDYFRDSSIDPAWLAWNPAGNVTAVEDTRGLVLTQPSGGSNQFSGRIRAAPADAQFVITTHSGLQGRGTSFSLAGVIVGEDLVTNPATDSFVCGCLTIDSGDILKVDSTLMANYSTFTSNNGKIQGFSPGNTVLSRIHVNRTGSLLTVLFSSNGRDWIQAGPQITFAAASLASIDYMGVVIDNFGTGQDASAIFDMFRVDVTSDPFFPIGGFRFAA